MLKEAKQVGILYHWTTPMRVFNIIRSNSLQSSRGYISFSRNKNLVYKDNSVCLVVDGNKLSTKYRIKPYRWADAISQKHEKDESEELIEANKINILEYLVGIKIDRNFPRALLYPLKMMCKRYNIKLIDNQ